MDKGQFLCAPAGAEKDVEISRGTVRVRALSRPEAVALAELAGDLAAQEQATIRYGLVDPQLDEAEVKEWYAQPGNQADAQTIVLAIQGLSLATKEATKSRVSGVRGKPGA